MNLRTVQLPQYGVGAGGQTQFAGQSSASLTAQGQTERMQGSGVRASATLMPTRQNVNVLGERAARALRIHTLEATHLDAKDDLLVQHWPFSQAPAIASIQSPAPASAGRTGCGTYGAAGLNKHTDSLLDTTDNTLAHFGQNTVDDSDNIRHDAPNVRSPRGAFKPPALGVTQSAGDPQI